MTRLAAPRHRRRDVERPAVLQQPALGRQPHQPEIPVGELHAHRRPHAGAVTGAQLGYPAVAQDVGLGIGERELPDPDLLVTSGLRRRGRDHDGAQHRDDRR
jgi:hypothetical protein